MELNKVQGLRFGARDFFLKGLKACLLQALGRECFGFRGLGFGQRRCVRSRRTGTDTLALLHCVFVSPTLFVLLITGGVHCLTSIMAAIESLFADV